MRSAANVGFVPRSVNSPIPDFAVTAKVRLDWPHCGGQVNVSFSNWAFGSSSFSFCSWIIVTHPGHASLRSLIDDLMSSLHACVGWAVESLALGRASRCAAAIFGFFHRPRPVRDDPVQVGCWVVTSCYTLHLLWTELGTICPHAVVQNGQFSRDSDDSATSPFGTHQAHPPGFDLRSSHRAHQ